MSRANKNFDAALEVIATVMRPGEILGQREIAEICGCSRSLIHQIEKKALRKIRERMRKEFGMSFEEFCVARVVDYL
jgi:transcriptional regulator